MRFQYFRAKQHTFFFLCSSTFLCVCVHTWRKAVLFQPAATDNLLLSHCVIFHSLNVVFVFACICGSVHICFFLSRVMSTSKLRFIYASLVVRGPDKALAVEARPENKCPASFLSVPDDFANGFDCLRQSFPRQASSSSNHHNNAFLPLMTHWAWLHNSHRHIASTQMCVYLCGASKP